MNLVGKIFTVLIFLMCVVFGTFALAIHAAHQNWKDKVMDLDQQLKVANKLTIDLAKQKKDKENALAEEKEHEKDRLIALENEKRVAEGQRDDMQARVAALEKLNRDLVQATDDITKRIDVLQTTIDGMRSDIKLTVEQRNEMQKKVMEITDELNNAVADRIRLLKLQGELAHQIVKMREYLAYTKADLENYKAKSPPEGLDR